MSVYDDIADWYDSWLGTSSMRERAEPVLARRHSDRSYELGRQ